LTSAKVQPSSIVLFGEILPAEDCYIAIGRADLDGEANSRQRTKNDDERVTRAVVEMDDEARARQERLKREEAELQAVQERSRERVGVAPDDLRHVVAAALSRIGFDLDKAEGDAVGRVKTYVFDPKDPAFAKDAGWDDAFDDLRIRPRKRGERLGDWRRNAPIRSIAFAPPIQIRLSLWITARFGLSLARSVIRQQDLQEKLVSLDLPTALARSYGFPGTRYRQSIR
jgi:hypothetical protein